MEYVLATYTRKYIVSLSHSYSVSGFMLLRSAEFYCLLKRHTYMHLGRRVWCSGVCHPSPPCLLVDLMVTTLLERHGGLQILWLRRERKNHLTNHAEPVTSNLWLPCLAVEPWSLPVSLRSFLALAVKCILSLFSVVHMLRLYL